MIWKIRHPYQSLIDAPTKGEAFRRMVERIKNDPASFVTDVQDATAVTPVKETPGLLRRVFRLK